MVDQHTSPRTATVPLHLSVTPGFQTEGCSWSCQGCGGRCTLSIGDSMWSQGWLLEMHLFTRIPKSRRCTVQGDAMCQAAYAASMCMETSPFGYPSGESFKTIVIINNHGHHHHQQQQQHHHDHHHHQQQHHHDHHHHHHHHHQPHHTGVTLQAGDILIDGAPCRRFGLGQSVQSMLQQGEWWECIENVTKCPKCIQMLQLWSNFRCQARCSKV